MIRELKFQNPVFHPGVNTTVRRGVQWDGETVAVIDGTEVQIQTAVFPFMHLPNGVLVMSHDPACRDWEGLRVVMERTYAGFDVREVVTVVYFVMP